MKCTNRLLRNSRHVLWASEGSRPDLGEGDEGRGVMCEAWEILEERESISVREVVLGAEYTTHISISYFVFAVNL
jgi:hypothetical protein